ncbi:MAG: hypothetical protein ACFFA3_21080, partial [Promethearchaeota archaeon]
GFHKHGPFNIILDRLDEKSEKEKLEFLKLQKMRISQDISRLNSRLKKIEDIILQLNNKTDRKGEL